MIENFHIRPYREADTKTLSAIWYEASLESHAFLGAARLKEQRRLIEDIYLPQAETWVACVSDRPVGFIGLLEEVVGGLFVSPSLQGRKVGATLLDHAGRLKGQLSLTVYADNGRAHRFYLRQGFEEVLRQPVDDEGLPFPIIRMRKPV